MANDKKNEPVVVEPKQKAVIHTATRVVKYLTIEENPVVNPDETLVVLDKKIERMDTFVKLDNKNEPIPATDKEIDDADVDENKIVLKIKKRKDDLIIAIDEILADSKIPSSLKNYFRLLKEFNFK